MNRKSFEYAACSALREIMPSRFMRPNGMCWLIIMLGAFTFYFVAVLIIRIRSELLAIKLRNARMGEVAMRQVPAE